MYNIFSSIRKGTLSQKIFSMFVAFAMLAQGSAFAPLTAYADVVQVVASSTDSSSSSSTSSSSGTTSTASAAASASSTSQVEIITSILLDLNTNVEITSSASSSASSTSSTSSDGTQSSASSSASSSSSVSVVITGGSGPTPESKPFRVTAHKIICDDVSMLPRWAHGGPDIASTTAQDYVRTHEGCRFATDWKFQWGFGANDSGETGVKSLSGDFVGEADGSKGQGTNTGTGYSDWKTFGPTNANGVTSVEISTIGGTPSSVWVREVLQNGFVPFTFDSAHPSNENATSSEIYCASDVLNYDNYDKIDRPVADGTYHCVAFNVKKPTPPEPPVCAVDVVSDETNYIDVIGGVHATATYNENPRWTAYIPGATWIWETFFVESPEENEYTTFVKEFVVPSTIASSSLVIASDNSYTVSINGTLVGADNTEFNYFEEGKDSYNVASFLHVGTNTISFTVKNWALAGSTPETNPAGLLYRLHVGLYGEGCMPPPPAPNTPPVITVLPPNPMTLTLGTTFTDPGATALDAEDGDITANIVKTGTVNTNATGTYTIFYNVTDSKGLAAAEKTRTVVVSAPEVCVAPLDVMLVIDRSGSMTDDGNPLLPLTRAKAAATTFVNTLSTTTDRVGLVSYNETATLNRALTSNFTAVKSSIAALTSGGATNIGDAFKKAYLEMDANSRTSAKHVIILLSDGLPNIPTNVASGTAYALSQATIAKTKGYVVYTIGLGTDVNPALMEQLATTPDNYYFAPTPAELDAIYRTIAAEECGRVPGTISGKKWNDRLGNAVVDGNDVGIADWQITLTSVGDNNATSRLAKTNVNGEFTFADVFPGMYSLCEIQKSGWTQTAPATTTTNGCYQIEVTPGVQITGKNFLNTENIKPQCSDGKDNDGDTKIDYPADTGCDSSLDNDENNPPVITILGDNPFTLTVGTTFTDPGATALDAEDGDITANIVKTGTVNTAIVGTYTITYNVKDSKGLAAPSKTRTVIVTSQCSDGKDNDGDGKVDMADTGCENPNDNDENNRPVITVLGLNPLQITLGDIFTDPGATAFDMEDGTITPNIVKTGTVNTNATGTYTIFYNITDSKGLAAVEKTRTVLVNPVLTECSDGKDNDGDTKIDYPADTGCDSTDDNDENNRPVITVLGDNPFSVHIGTTFTDPGATAFDMEDGTITPVTASGTVDMLHVGAYTIFYNVKDSDGLAAVEKTRIVNVVSSCSDGKDNDGDTKIDYPADTGCTNPDDDTENQAPTLTLLGDAIMSLVVGTTFTDPGATALDAEDGDITANIVKTGTVNTATLGAYFLAYNVKDSQGLAADTATRTVNIVPAVCTVNCGGGGGGSDNNRPIITLKGANPLIVTQGTSFIDPGATAFDAEDGDVTANIVVGGTVDTNKLGDYELTYNVSDSKGLPAQQVKRTVTVASGGGGGSITLSIYNEKLAVTSTTTVTITWNTNQPATSRVVYGLDTHATLGNAPLYGYQLTTATATALVTSHSMVIENIPSAIATYFRPVSTDGVRTATGIELTRTPLVVVPESCFYLREYMRLGANNNPLEVIKLQTFLNAYEGFTDLRVTGIFDITTDQAVRSFQDKYAADVLTPWNLPGNTGYVYYTTQKKINEIYCKRSFPLTDTQIAEIATFRELVNRISTQGGEVLPTLPLVGVNTEAPAVTTGGAVAGATTEVEESEAVASGVASAETEQAPQPRGRIALADLLATMPTVSDSLEEKETTGTTSDLSTSTKEEVDGVVMGTSTKKGLGAVITSISERTKLSAAGVYVLLVLVITSIVLSVIIGRRYYVAKKAAADPLGK